MMTERWTPPLWLRHVVPWCVLRALDRRLPTCWAGMASWKQGEERSWWPRWTCWDGDPLLDYCGKFSTPPVVTFGDRTLWENDE